MIKKIKNLIKRLILVPEFLYLTFKYVELSSIPNGFMSRLFFIPLKIKFKDGNETEFLGLATLRFYKYKRELVDKKNNIYCLFINNRKFYTTFLSGPLIYSSISGEMKKYYPADFKNKKVLDVGGNIGDSAIYFLDEGASFVDIYEPVERNIKIIKMNLNCYPQEKYKINNLAVSDKDGILEIRTAFPLGSGAFGANTAKFLTKLFKIESKTYRFSCISFNTILKKNSYDIAKIDCEGCEEALANTKDELIRKVPLWLIETHSKQIEQKILEKFEQNNFTKVLIHEVGNFKIYKFIRNN